ncbi:MAG TPA: GerMN domain-containing protein, partial [Acidimicrobiia bacterium]|nr:GerMN domain-containing protein [Acidimicrobiia bacterium]
MSHDRRFLLLAALALVVASCGDGGSAESTTTESPTTTGPITTTEAPATTTTSSPASTTLTVGTMGHVVYLILEDVGEGTGGPFLVPVYREGPAGDPAIVPLELLMEGPTTDEAAGVPAIHTAIPEGTSVLGVTVDGGVATVDLSGEFDDGGGSASMFARLAQVVYTVTRATQVDEVSFYIDGDPVTVFSSEGIELDGPQARSDYYGNLPAIFIESPAWGEPVTSPIQVEGLSNVFEAVSQVMLTDDDGL